MRTALTIAGSDPSGGAGVQADLKAFSRFRVYGMAVLTLVTVQNTLGVERVEQLPPSLVHAQIQAVARDLPIHAAKTGALGSAGIVEEVAGAVRGYGIAPLVVDPVMAAKSGDLLLEEDAVEALRASLFPQAFLITPNRLEAEALLKGRIESLKDAKEAAQALLALGPRAVLLKGGHFEGVWATDLLATKEGVRLYRSRRIESRNTHGTGCTLSAAITALLARGMGLEEAVERAKRYLTQALKTAPGLGGGVGPLNHFARMG